MKKRILISMIMLLVGYSAMLKPMWIPLNPPRTGPLHEPITGGDLKKYIDILGLSLDHTLTPTHISYVIRDAELEYNLWKKYPTLENAQKVMKESITKFKVIIDLLNDNSLTISPEGRTLIQKAVEKAQASFPIPPPPVAPAPVQHLQLPLPEGTSCATKKDEPKAAQGAEKNN